MREQNNRTYIYIGCFESYLALFNTLMGAGFEFIESVLTILGFVTTGLRHTAHPLQFGTIEIGGTSLLGTTIVNALLTLLKIIGIIATIGINGMVIQFEDYF